MQRWGRRAPLRPSLRHPQRAETSHQPPCKFAAPNSGRWPRKHVYTPPPLSSRVDPPPYGTTRSPCCCPEPNSGADRTSEGPSHPGAAVPTTAPAPKPRGGRAEGGRTSENKPAQSTVTRGASPSWTAGEAPTPRPTQGTTAATLPRVGTSLGPAPGERKGQKRGLLHTS